MGVTTNEIISLAEKYIYNAVVYYAGLIAGRRVELSVLKATGAFGFSNIANIAPKTMSKEASARWRCSKKLGRCLILGCCIPFITSRCSLSTFLVSRYDV